VTSVLLVGDDGSRETAGKGTGACIARTGRFRNALEEAGLQVTVCSPSELATGAAEIRHLLRDGSFTCIVAISPFPAEAAIMAKPVLPIWIDMNGNHPAEIQLQGNEDCRAGERLARILALENSLLLRGDIFSTPSRRQACAVAGELLLLGRLGHRSAGVVPMIPIPHCALGEFDESRAPGQKFIIISTGSFNQWFDEQTLFTGLESAMEKDDSIRFVSTGGGIPFSPGKYDRFRKMVEGSPFRDRFTLHGWVQLDILKEVYGSASAAVYTDIPALETFLGARTRTLDWINRGIPVICTDGAEISEEIGNHGLGLVVPPRNPQALSDAFLRLASSLDLSRKITARQKTWCSTHGSSEKLFRPLVSWCSDPSRLPPGSVGNPTIPRMNSIGYLRLIFRELAVDRGPGYAISRLLAKLFQMFRRD